MSKNTLYDLTGEYLMLQEMLEDPDVDPEVVQDWTHWMVILKQS